MVRTVLNAFRVPEIRKKLAFTAAILALYRLGSFIPVPGVDTEAVKADLKSLWGTFAEISGLNMVIDPDVQGTVDIVLRCLTGMRALGPVLRIDPARRRLGAVVRRLDWLARFRIESAPAGSRLEIVDRNGVVIRGAPAFVFALSRLPVTAWFALPALLLPRVRRR